MAMARVHLIGRTVAWAAAWVCLAGCVASAEQLAYYSQQWRLVGQKTEVYIYRDQGVAADVRLYRLKDPPTVQELTQSQWDGDLARCDVVERPKYDVTRNRVEAEFEKPGLYFLVWQGDKETKRYWRFSVSDLRATNLWQGRDPVLWCWDARTAQPAADVSIKLYHDLGKAGTPIKATDEHGLSRAGIGDQSFSWALLRRGEHFAVVSLTGRSAAETTRLCLTTDRLSYRPGESVWFRCVARQFQGGRWVPLVNGEVTVEATESASLGTTTRKTDEFGVCTGEWTAPPLRSPAWVSLRAAADGVSSWQAIHIAPEGSATVSLAAEKPRFSTNDKVVAHLVAADRLGQALGNRTVFWQLLPLRWHTPLADSKGLEWLLGEPGFAPWMYHGAMAQGTARTDEGGHARIETPAIGASGWGASAVASVLVASVDTPEGSSDVATEVRFDVAPPSVEDLDAAYPRASPARLRPGDTMHVALPASGEPQRTGVFTITGTRTSLLRPLEAGVGEEAIVDYQVTAADEGVLYLRWHMPAPCPEGADTYYGDPPLQVWQSAVVVEPTTQLLPLEVSVDRHRVRAGEQAELTLRRPRQPGASPASIAVVVAEELGETVLDDQLRDARAVLYEIGPPPAIGGVWGFHWNQLGRGWQQQDWPAALSLSAEYMARQAGLWPIEAQESLAVVSDLTLGPGEEKTIAVKAERPGRFRLVAQAAGRDGSVGQAVEEFQVEGPPLRLSLVAPQRLTIADTGIAHVALHNPTADVQRGELRLTTEGVRAGQVPRQVAVAAGAREYLPVTVEAVKEGSGELAASLKAAGSEVTVRRPIMIAARPDEPDQGERMFLRRRYIVLKDGPAGVEREWLRGSVAPGQAIDVVLGLKLDRDADQVVIRDSVPGGCDVAALPWQGTAQPELANLAHWLGLDAGQASYYYGGYRYGMPGVSIAPEVQDGFVTFAARKPKAGQFEVSYRLIAQDPGRYAIGPALGAATEGDRTVTTSYDQPSLLRIALQPEVRLASARLAADGLHVTMATANRGESVTGSLTLTVEGSDGRRETIHRGRLRIPRDTGEQDRLADKPTLGIEGLMLEAAFRAADVVVTDVRSLQSLAGRQTLRILGQNEWSAGTRAAVRLIALTEADSRPIGDAVVSLALLPEEGDEPAQPLFEGTTDAKGTVDAVFEVPEGSTGARRLVAKVGSDYGEETIEQPVTIEDPTKILLTTDKPLYQPMQMMHIRALALRRHDLTPMAETKATIEVEDAKGNKVFKQSGDTSEFGVLSADFQLADWVNEGEYRVRCLVGETQIEKVVTVKKYVLPKFKVDLETDQDFYYPGDTVKGSAQCDYFFGKPVRAGKVTLIFSTFVEQFTEFARVAGTTDDSGHWDFELTLPDHFVGTPIAEGNATIDVKAEVVDTADHKETKHSALTVSGQPINVVVLPESGQLVPGVPNTVYVAASYPDGSPAEVDLVVRDKADGREVLSGKTDSLGLAEFRLVPPPQPLALQIDARDSQGREASHERAVSADPSGGAVLLRTNKALSKVGETLQITALTTERRGTVYLDVIKNRQTLLTEALDLQDGKATLNLPLTPDMSGTLALSAYKIARSGEMVRDERPVYVEPANDLKINIAPDRSTYGPAEPARIDFHVTDAEGKGVLAALGVTIVDESVFALQEAQPGLLKVYFTLEKEILQPRYQIKGFQMPDLVVAGEEPGEEPKPEPQRERAAEVLMASATQIAGYSVDVNTRADREGEAKQRAQKILQAIYGRNYFHQYRDQRDAYFKRHKAYPEQREGVAHLARLDVVEKADTRDPWGQEYVLAFRPAQWGPTLTVISRGPDGALGTIDDIEAQQPDYYYGYWYVLTDSAQQLFSRGAPSEGAFYPLYGLGSGEGLPRLDVPFHQWAADDRVMSLITVGGLAYDGYGNFRGMREAAQGPPSPSAAPGGAAGYGGGRGDAGMAGPGGPPGAYGPPESEGGAPPEREVRIREYFPETLLAEPQLITDEQGRASLELDMADSITEWRLTALGSSLGGLLGSRTVGVKCFQDFFVDIDLPVALTQNDEVTIPIAIYNYLREPQTVRIQLNAEDWFELQGDSEQQVRLAANEVDAVHYKLKVTGIGRHTLTAFGHGTDMSDAIKRQIEVVPDGKEFRDTVNDRLPRDGCQHDITVPEDAIDEASRLWVKVYPGVFSQVVEGLESMFRMPFG